MTSSVGVTLWRARMLQYDYDIIYAIALNTPLLGS